MNDRAELPQITIGHIERMIAEGKGASLPTDIIETYTRQVGKFVPPNAGSTPADQVVSFADRESTRAKASRPVRHQGPRTGLHMANTAQARGFLKLMRTSITEALLCDKNALHLLTVIGYRARWSSEANLDNLTFGQALIGDFSAIGLTRAEYRAAMTRLAKWRLVTFFTSNRGTIATLLDSRVFSLTDERDSSKSDHQDNPRDDQQLSLGDSQNTANQATIETTGEQPASNQRTTTNQKDRRKEGSEGNTNAALGPATARVKNELFDGLAEATGSQPSELVGRAAKACGVAIAEIKKATPDVTPSEIKRRAYNYVTHYKDAALTPLALAKHWSVCRVAKANFNPRKQVGSEIDYAGDGGWNDPKAGS